MGMLFCFSVGAFGCVDDAPLVCVKDCNFVRLWRLQQAAAVFVVLFEERGVEKRVRSWCVVVGVAWTSLVRVSRKLGFQSVARATHSASKDLAIRRNTLPPGSLWRAISFLTAVPGTPARRSPPNAPQTAPVGGAEQARRVRQDADGAVPGVLPDERPRQERLRQERADRREDANLV